MSKLIKTAPNGDIYVANVRTYIAFEDRPPHWLMLCGSVIGAASFIGSIHVVYLLADVVGGGL